MQNIAQSLSSPNQKTGLPKKFMNLSAKAWFLTTVVGQWLFAFYVAAFYGGSAMSGDFMKWNRVLPHGYTEGESMSNLAVALHLLFSVIVLLGGPLQFSAKLRAKFPKFHRISGRVYIFSGILISLSGIYMVVTKGTVSGWLGDVSISINAFLVVLCAFFAVRQARQKQFASHQRWAMRLFLVMSGVWFFRIGLMFWLLVNGGPVGFDPVTFRGPFLVFLGFGQYTLPLLFAEMFFWANKRKKANTYYTMSGVLAGLTIFTALGTFAATLMMWLPRL
ncbi:MAG: DUF2306 domain-containing protein [Bacteroidota bacterium]